MVGLIDWRWRPFWRPEYGVGVVAESSRPSRNDTLRSSTTLNGSLPLLLCSSGKEAHFQIDLCVIHANSSKPHWSLDP